MLVDSGNHYLRFAVNPPCTDELTIRKTLQDALLQSFGLTSANTYVDMMWCSEQGTEAVVRISASEATKLMAAVTAYTGTLKLSLIRNSSFLPALLSSVNVP